MAKEIRCDYKISLQLAKLLLFFFFVCLYTYIVIVFEQIRKFYYRTLFHLSYFADRKMSKSLGIENS